MKEINQIVTDYLKIKKTDYALMIKGDWGCGKTYYVKNTLFKKIEKIESFLNKKNKVFKKYEPLYISLFGLDEISDMLYKIHLELNPWLKSKPWAIAKISFDKIASFFHFNVFKKEDERNFLSVFTIPQNKVLFFDDLERTDNLKLSIKSILGQINHFTEQENLKVIIICNSEKTKEIFSSINEKSIRFSCLYKPVLHDVYDEMILEYNHDYKSFLKTNKSIIIETFEVAKYLNLRTLRFILDIFQKIFNITREKEYNDEILKRFLLFTAIYSIEYKTDTQSREELNSLSEVGPFDIIDYMDIAHLFPEIKTEKEETEPSFIQKFRKKYSAIIESFYYCLEIADYIHNGYLNEEKLLQIINDLIKEIKSKEETEETRLINSIRNWQNINDADFEPLKCELIEKTKSGTFSLATYPIIFAEFLQIEHYQLYSLNIDRDFIEVFKNGIDKAKLNHEYDKSFVVKMPQWSMNDKTQAKDKYNIIYDYTLQANYETVEKIYLRINDSIYSNLDQNKGQELKNIFSDPEHLDSPFLKNIDINKFFELLLKANSETINALNTGIYIRYSDTDIKSGRVSILKSETEFFTKLLSLVSNRIEKTNERKISIVPFINLERNLKRFSIEN